jgi:hypothetical protein
MITYENLTREEQNLFNKIDEQFCLTKLNKQEYLRVLSSLLNKYCEVKNINEIKTEEEAREIAMDFIPFFLENDLSYSELAEYQYYLEEIGKKFNLLEEFEENGII